MQNLEVRIRLASWGSSDCLGLGEIPFRAEAIEAVIPLLGKWGGMIGGVEFGSGDISMQFADDEERAFLEVIIEDGDAQ